MASEKLNVDNLLQNLRSFAGFLSDADKTKIYYAVFKAENNAIFKSIFSDKKALFSDTITLRQKLIN